MSTSTAKLSKGGTAVVIDPAHDLLRVEGHPLDSIFSPRTPLSEPPKFHEKL